MSQDKLKAYLKILYAASKIVTFYFISAMFLLFRDMLFLMKKNGYRKPILQLKHI